MEREGGSRVSMPETSGMCFHVLLGIFLVVKCVLNDQNRIVWIHIGQAGTQKSLTRLTIQRDPGKCVASTVVYEVPKGC